MGVLTTADSASGRSVPDDPVPGGHRRKSIASVMILAGAVAAGQLLALAAAPLLTRLYQPEAFGVLAAFSAIVSISVSIASFRYEMAIPIASNAAAAAHLLLVSLLLVAGSSLLLLTSWFLAGEQLSDILGVPDLAALGWALAIAVLAAGSYQALVFWNLRGHRYGTIATTRLIQAASGVMTQLALGLAGPGIPGLVVGEVAGRSAGLLTLLRSAGKSVASAGVTRVGLWAIAAQHHSFSRTMAAAAILNSAALYAPYLFFPGTFGVATAGMYFLAHRMLAIPAILIGGSVGQVFFGEAAGVRSDPAQLRRLATQVALTLVAFGLPLYGSVAIMGSHIFVVVFGAEWSDAGTFAQWLAPSLLLWSVASPLSSMLVVGRRERESVIFTGVELATRIAAIMVGAALKSPTVAVALLGLSGVVLNLTGVWRFLRPAGVTLASLVPMTGAIALANVPGFVLLALLSTRSPGWWSVAVSGGSVIVGMAAAFLFVVRRRTAEATSS